MAQPSSLSSQLDGKFFHFYYFFLAVFIIPDIIIIIRKGVKKMNDPKRNQNSGQNQSDLNQEDSGQSDQGIAGGTATTDDTQVDANINQSNEDMSTEE